MKRRTLLGTLISSVPILLTGCISSDSEATNSETTHQMNRKEVEIKVYNESNSERTVDLVVVDENEREVFTEMVSVDVDDIKTSTVTLETSGEYTLQATTEDGRKSNYPFDVSESHGAVIVEIYDDDDPEIMQEETGTFE